MAANRSSPAPVSTDGRGSGVSFPEASRSNCMKTRFQISSVSSPGPLTSAAAFPARLVAPVVVELRARPARPRFAHRPEVVLLAEAQDPRGGKVPFPELRGLVVLGIDGRPQPRGIESVALLPVRHELPGEPDRLVLEVVAEREVPEHLEERLVAPGVARRCRGRCACRRPGRTSATVVARAVVALLAAGEDVLELVHPGVGEEQRRVLGRDQRRRRNAAVPALLEVAQEPLPDLTRLHTRPG